MNEGWRAEHVVSTYLSRSRMLYVNMRKNFNELFEKMKEMNYDPKVGLGLHRLRTGHAVAKQHVAFSSLYLSNCV